MENNLTAAEKPQAAPAFATREHWKAQLAEGEARAEKHGYAAGFGYLTGVIAGMLTYGIAEEPGK